MAEASTKRKIDNHIEFFIQEKLEKTKASNTIDNYRNCLRRFFCWYHDTVHESAEDYKVYSNISTHQSDADPEYAPEEICSKTRREIKEVIFSDSSNQIDAEECLKYEKDNKNRGSVKQHFRDKIKSTKKLEKVKLTEEDIRNVNKELIADFVNHLREDLEVKKSTARKYVNSLDKFLKFYSSSDYHQIRDPIHLDYGKVQDELDADWDKGKNLSKRERKNLDKSGKKLSPEQIKKLIKSRGTEEDRAMILVMVKTGIRRAELTNIHMDDIDLDEKWIYIRERKGGKQGNVIFDSECKYYLSSVYEARINEIKKEKLIKEKMEEEDITRAAVVKRLRQNELSLDDVELEDEELENEYLFTHGSGNKYSPNTITKKYKSWARDAGFDEDEFRGPHDLRHTFAKHYRLPDNNPEDWDMDSTKEGKEVFRRIQMSHSENTSTGEG
ncbi:MAG: tyrosine-type recombinase/integrase, partial [Candidatus Nanohalobium sp.]